MTEDEKILYGKFVIVGSHLLNALGESRNDILAETPHRYARACIHNFSGNYSSDVDLEKLFKTFSNSNDDMVVQIGIPVTSWCEHHILPFFGTCNIGYVPNGKVIGASKLTRIVRHFARRLQTQENLTQQIANILYDKLKCKGVICTMKCTHLCMVYRGVEEKTTPMITSSVLGLFREDNSARQEFLQLSGGPPALI